MVYGLHNFTMSDPPGSEGYIIVRLVPFLRGYMGYVMV